MHMSYLWWNRASNLEPSGLEAKTLDSGITATCPRLCLVDTSIVPPARQAMDSKIKLFRRICCVSRGHELTSVEMALIARDAKSNPWMRIISVLS
ncbi:hypothetical protein AVEN_148359-1 [Araneus ventricosus]|uniref:Uncharacterized protein n=1 Tax=Araneus ventricosus TaxID=182803 RepID=A0A4Y2U252_ARAVE|nr:hypothetical protein AVEN_148359-1 [Araneus ventricosus]